jgi:hypothetical protein
VDVFGRMPGYWIDPNLAAASFEKNMTKWSGAQQNLFH